MNGSRARRLRSSHSYGLVLCLVVSSFLFTALAPASAWSRSVVTLIESGTLIAALWTSGHNLAGVAFFALALFGFVTAIAGGIGGATVIAAVGIVTVLLLLAACVAIAIGVADQGNVNKQSILGAISIYLAIGMLFTFAYNAAAVLGSGPFFAQATDGTPSIRLYFSFVTLATVGYGDYTPAGDVGRTLAVTEAILGQLYLVTVLAVLVANFGQSRRGPRD